MIKKISSRHILALPEPAFTIDAAKYDELRSYSHRVRIVIKESGTVYEMTAEAFDIARKVYDYGNGRGYRVPVKFWKKAAEQMPLL